MQLLAGAIGRAGFGEFSIYFYENTVTQLRIPSSKLQETRGIDCNVANKFNKKPLLGKNKGGQV